MRGWVGWSGVESGRVMGVGVGGVVEKGGTVEKGIVGSGGEWESDGSERVGGVVGNGKVLEW